jgi:tape measure domain-containing protein
MKNYEVVTTFKAIDKMSRVVSGMESKLAKFTGKTSMVINKVDRAMTGMISKIGHYAKIGFGVATIAAGGLIYGIKKVMESFSMFENATASFTPLMGGIEGATKLVTRLQQEVASTPFEFEHLADVATQLLPMMNKDIDETVKRMRIMGDVSGGNAEKMTRVTRGYMKALLKGKVDMESLNMIAEAGIPINLALAESMGISTEKLSKMVSSGKVKVSDLNKAFETMTSKGGMFYKGMDLMSLTLTGRLSTLYDDAKRTAGEFGSVLAPVIKDLVDKAIAFIPVISKWIENNKALIASKFKEYVEKIINIFKWIFANTGKIYAWGKAIFWVVAGVKAANIAFATFNQVLLLKNAMSASSAIMALSSNVSIATTGAAGLGVALGAVFAAGAVGVGVGLAIHQYIIEPLMKALDTAKKLNLELDDSMNKEKNPQRTNSVLENDRKLAVAKLWSLRVQGETGAKHGGIIADPMADKYNELVDYIKRLDNRIAVQRMEANVTKYQEADQTSWNDIAPWEADVAQPQAEVGQSRQDSLEITIKDETGRARVTRTTSPIVPKLIPTGAMN